jgi:hypothetical protein
MKKIVIFIFISVALLISGCDDFLSEEPVGEFSEDQVKSNYEMVVIAAYSALNGQFDEASNAYNSPASNWSFGDVCSDDYYKGGGGTGDQNQIHLLEIFQVDPSIKDLERKWRALYEGVSRSNNALRVLKEADASQEIRDQLTAEIRFLRGHYYFELKKIFSKIAWFDETVTDLNEVTNTSMTSEEIWSKIEEDFKAAYDVLPLTQSEPGRPTKWAAQSYLCKTYIFQQKWTEASVAADSVIASGAYELNPNFPAVFMAENDNGTEIVFSVQYSINDGSPQNYNGSIGDRLNPPGGVYPGYGFHRPSQNLINAFKTDANGLPVNDNINVVASDMVDVRLDHSCGRHGIPYKDLGVLFDSSWCRDLATYGPYGPKKRVLSWTSEYQLNNWPYVNAMNYYVIRYADVLLWKAEAAIELNDLETGRTYINMIRNRAKQSETVLSLDGTTDAANYLTEPYATPFAGFDEAISALRVERRLEFAEEGHRFFDLVRWGIADQVMNDYFEVEKTRRTHLNNALFIKDKHEYWPIPQAQIDLAGGYIEQLDAYR